MRTDFFPLSSCVSYVEAGKKRGEEGGALETIARLKVDKYTCMYACVGLLVERMGMGSSEDPWTPLGREKRVPGLILTQVGEMTEK